MQVVSVSASASDTDAGCTQHGSEAYSDGDLPCKVPRLTHTVISSDKPVEATCFFCNKPGP